MFIVCYRMELSKNWLGSERREWNEEKQNKMSGKKENKMSRKNREWIVWDDKWHTKNCTATLCLLHCIALLWITMELNWIKSNESNQWNEKNHSNTCLYVLFVKQN